MAKLQDLPVLIVEFRDLAKEYLLQETVGQAKKLGRFAGFSLGASDKVKLFSGCGTDSATELYWCTGAVWNNDGDTATLRDTDNSIVDTFTY